MHIGKINEHAFIAVAQAAAQQHPAGFITQFLCIRGCHIGKAQSSHNHIELPVRRPPEIEKPLYSLPDHLVQAFVIGFQDRWAVVITAEAGTLVMHTYSTSAVMNLSWRFTFPLPWKHRRHCRSPSRHWFVHVCFRLSGRWWIYRMWCWNYQWGSQGMYSTIPFLNCKPRYIGVWIASAQADIFFRPVNHTQSACLQCPFPYGKIIVINKTVKVIICFEEVSLF